MLVDWAGAGVPTQVLDAPLPVPKGAACPPCADPRRPVLHLATCKCYAVGSDALRKKGVCPPRVVTRKGVRVTVDTVAVTRNGRTRCVQTGGAVAKQVLGNSRACPPGKVLKEYTQRRGVPRRNGTVASPRTYTFTRCVKAAGDLKNCPGDQVVVFVPSRGVAPGGRRWAKDVKRCMRPTEAAERGFERVRGGRLPIPRYLLKRQ